MHYKDLPNKCNRSLYSEYNTMQTNALVEDRVTDSTLCLLYLSFAMFHTRTADISRPHCPRRQCKIFQMRGFFSN